MAVLMFVPGPGRAAGPAGTDFRAAVREHVLSHQGGGSIPMHLFANVSGAPVVGLPIVNHDNAQHAADENLRLQNLWDGILVFTEVLHGTGQGW